MKSLIDRRLQETRCEGKIGTSSKYDKNMVIVNIPTMFTVGTSFKIHPPYPQLGDRIIYINNGSKSD